MGNLRSRRLHLRRCHYCGHVNEGEEELIHNCSHCKKNLAPFYYFDESKIIGLKSEEEANAEYKSSALPWREYPPVLGLTVYWEKS
jgi:predicted  nucleic acid-binding Zn-ribbon protein